MNGCRLNLCFSKFSKLSTARFSAYLAPGDSFASSTPIGNPNGDGTINPKNYGSNQNINPFTGQPYKNPQEQKRIEKQVEKRIGKTPLFPESAVRKRAFLQRNGVPDPNNCHCKSAYGYRLDPNSLPSRYAPSSSIGTVAYAKLSSFLNRWHKANHHIHYIDGSPIFSLKIARCSL